MHSRLSCWHHSRLLWRQEHPLPRWGHQARQSATLHSLPSTGPPGPRSDHCNDPPFCNVNPSLIKTILPKCSCDQVPPYLMTLPLILDHMTSSLRWYTRLFMACLNPPPPAQHCTVCDSPSLPLPGRAFPSHMLQLTPRPRSNPIFPRSSVSQPRAVNIAVTFDFYQNNYMFTLEFLPFLLGEQKMPHQLLSEFDSLHFPLSPEIVPYEHRQGHCSRHNGFSVYTAPSGSTVALEEMGVTFRSSPAL